MITKCSVLVAFLDDGSLHSVASPVMQPIDELARKVRAERSILVGKKQCPVVQAVVISSNGGAADVIKRIPCAAEANREKIVAEQKAKIKKA